VRTDCLSNGRAVNPLVCRLGVFVLLNLACVLTGCQQPGLPPAVALSRPEQLALEARALNLLLVAAESDLDDVSSNAIEALVRVAPQDGLPVFREAVQSPSPLVRYAALVALGEMRDRGSLERVTSAVRDPHPHVRLAAAFAACRCGKSGYARLLLRELSESPEEALRADAATLIGRLEEPAAARALRVALSKPENKKSLRVTLALHGALAMLGDADSLEQLIYYSQGATEARADALLILAELGNANATEALRYRLLGAAEEYDEARLIAARGLGRLGYADGLALAARMLGYADSNRQPTPDNPDRTFTVRSLAIHALAEIGDRRCLAALGNVAADESNPRLQVAACYAICRILAQDRP